MSFDQLAAVSGLGASSGWSDKARAVVASVDRGANALDAARSLKARLAKDGWRDDPDTCVLHEMIEKKAGNCLGLTLFLGAALLEAGHSHSDVRFVLRLNPHDDVHVAGEEHFAELCDLARGVHADSRLPDASDRTRRFRFAPVEHASLLLTDGEGKAQPFEATNLENVLDVDPAWAPESEAVRTVTFDALVTTVLSERAKMMLHRSSVDDAGHPRVMTNGDAAERKMLKRALRLALEAVRLWPGNREGCAEAWRISKAISGYGKVANAIAFRYADIGATTESAESLYSFTRYRMMGKKTQLDMALSAFPAFAEAYFEKNVALPMKRGDADDETRRHCAISAWMVIGSEVMDPERFFRERAETIGRVFSPQEIEEVISSFERTRLGAARSPASS